MFIDGDWAFKKPHKGYLIFSLNRDILVLVNTSLLLQDVLFNVHTSLLHIIIYQKYKLSFFRFNKAVWFVCFWVSTTWKYHTVSCKYLIVHYSLYQNVNYKCTLRPGLDLCVLEWVPDQDLSVWEASELEFTLIYCRIHFRNFILSHGILEDSPAR